MSTYIVIAQQTTTAGIDGLVAYCDETDQVTGGGLANTNFAGANYPVNSESPGNHERDGYYAERNFGTNDPRAMIVWAVCLDLPPFRP